MGSLRDSIHDELDRLYRNETSEFRDATERILGLLVEEACAGAVVEDLPLLPPPVPVAHVGALEPIAEAVAQRLAEGLDCCCQDHDAGGSSTCCPTHTTFPRPAAKNCPCSPPFAAAVITRDGRQTWVLASAACEECGGEGQLPNSDGTELTVDPCEVCAGYGVKVNALELALRYDHGAKGDPRLARFTLESGS